MAKKRTKKPPRPKLRKWFPHRGQTWLKLEPAGLALTGGLFFATCAMVLYLVRQLAGAPMDLQDVVTGVALTFFVSYTGIGFFVWYLLHLAETELDKPKKKGSVEPGFDVPQDPVPAADTQADPVQETAEIEEQQ